MMLFANLQRSIREEGNYKPPDIVLEVPSSKREVQVTDNRINPAKAKSFSDVLWVSAPSSSSKECSAPHRLELCYFLSLGIFQKQDFPSPPALFEAPALCS